MMLGYDRVQMLVQVYYIYYSKSIHFRASRLTNYIPTSTSPPKETVQLPIAFENETFFSLFFKSLQNTSNHKIPTNTPPTDANFQYMLVFSQIISQELRKCHRYLMIQLAEMERTHPRLPFPGSEI